MLVRFSKEANGAAPSFGVLEDEKITDLSSTFENWASLLSHVNSKQELPGAGSAQVFMRDEVQLLAPLEASNKVLCVALNYQDHVRENNAVPPDSPIFFQKTSQAVIGPEDEIHFADVTQFLDYEAEIAVVIGSPMKNVNANDVLDYVAGFTALNDVSARDLLRVPAGERVHLDWFSCKSLDHSTPIGPAVTTRQEFGEFNKASVQTRVNGELVQDSTPEDMVVPLSELLAFVSTRTTLVPGDIVATGTPGGVGSARGVSLKEGDEVEIQISNIPPLKNTVRVLTGA
jgi:acylpyruvate hydrolase